MISFAKLDELLPRMREGDREAFDQAMALLLRQTLRAAQRAIRCREDAEDIAQIVLAELWRKRETIPPGISGEEFATRFLTAIAKRRTMDHLRRDLRRKNLADFLSLDEEAVGNALSAPHLGDVVIAVVDHERKAEKKAVAWAARP
ncbi:MAG: RNA polymerase sigma factor [Fimbriimonas sp.]